MTVRIVIPGDHPPQIQGSAQLERLKPFGEVVLHLDRPATKSEQVARAAAAVCLVNTRGAVKWPRELLEQLPQLRMITVCGIGTDSIDLDFCKKAGITVCNVPGKTAPIVAEHALALMLAVARRTAFQTAALKRGEWSGLKNVSLRGKTLGLIGTGNIGAELAKMASALSMRVLAWSFHPSAERGAKLGVGYVGLDELLGASDVVSVHVKMTPETRGLIGASQIARMRPGSILINTARGGIVDTAALIDALQRGHLAGAGLDVFDQEPVPKDDPLLQCEHVVLTPHNADQTPEGIELLNQGVVDNVVAFLKGEPQNRVV